MKLLALLLSCAFSVSAATTNSLSQWGITFQFSNSVDYGTFANGDYWVVAPVTVTNMLPAWDGTLNGWEINPVVTNSQGFYDDTLFDSGKQPALPLVLSSNCSLVKVIGTNADVDTSWVLSAAVLTVLTNAPTNNGAGVFRPPYVGSDKPQYLVSALRTDLLPSFATVTNVVTLTAVSSNFNKCLRMDHNSLRPRWYRPINAMYGYQPNNTPTLNEAMLRLMMNDSAEDKADALLYFTQHCIDQAYAVLNGYRRFDDGHNPNHRILAAWGATLLDIQSVKDYMATAIDFHEDRYLYSGTNGVALWGEPATEWQYWNYVMNEDGGRSNKDPYNYIDGGELIVGAGASYQVIVSQSLKGQALVYRLFPQLQDCIPSAQYALLSGYAARWVSSGVWALPDPAAPFDGNTNNYTVTFGPDGDGSYIAGSGRFPLAHATNADGGQYKSAYVAAMWNAYWTQRKATLNGTATFGGTFRSN